jgi:membrane-associated phospholipid phosphatase
VSNRRLLELAAMMIVATVVSIVLVDDFVRRASWLPGLAVWREGQRAIEIATGIDAHRWWWLGAILATAAVAVARPAWRHMALPFLYVAVVHVSTRYAFIWIKELTGRLRPYQLSWPAADARQSFMEQGGLSFPSGHAALYFGLALPLARLYPRYRAPLYAIALFMSLARIFQNAHWVSDVTASVALVALVTALMPWPASPARSSSPAPPGP